MHIEELTSQEVVQELDKYIIGQQNAKKSVAIALRNRWRRSKTSESIKHEIFPNNIILIGPTGVGKTEIARRLAKLTNAPFVKVEATKYTEVGYIGRDVESMVRDLAEQSAILVKQKKINELEDIATQNAYKIILEKLLPSTNTLSSFDLGDEADGEDFEQLNTDTFNSLKNGELNDKIIEIDVQIESSVQVLGPFGGGDEFSMQLQDMMGSMLPKKFKKKSTNIAEAFQIIKNQELEKALDLDSISKEAIANAENNGIIFIDEIDKIASKHSQSSSPDVSREGVQRDLLPIIEGTAVQTKYGILRTDHVLFIASGAFHVSKPSDLIPELQGRFPIRVELQALSEQDFIEILTKPENAILKQYQALLSTENVELHFTDEAIQEIAASAVFINDQTANIGARRLQTILSALLEDLMYESKGDSKTYTVDKDYVVEKIKAISGKIDVGMFIL